MQSWQGQVLTALLGLLGLIVTAAIPIVVRWLVKKLKLEHDGLIEAEIHKLLDLGVAYAEEQGHKAIKAKLDAPSGNQKLDLAAEFVLGVMRDRKLPERGADAIKALLEARLQTGRVDEAKTMTDGSVTLTTVKPT